ncbi:MAG TPA: oxidoreductase, partial [Armatimonadetes bacterium]|nr:oxidoreductase [Armatimonadota bacterium]
MASPTLGWGFIGAGGVARRRMLPAVVGHEGVRLAAVQVRDQARAEA